MVTSLGTDFQSLKFEQSWKNFFPFDPAPRDLSHVSFVGAVSITADLISVGILICTESWEANSLAGLITIT